MVVRGVGADVEGGERRGARVGGGGGRGVRQSGGLAPPPPQTIAPPAPPPPPPGLRGAPLRPPSRIPSVSIQTLPGANDALHVRRPLSRGEKRRSKGGEEEKQGWVGLRRQAWVRSAEQRRVCASNREEKETRGAQARGGRESGCTIGVQLLAWGGALRGFAPSSLTSGSCPLATAAWTSPRIGWLAAGIPADDPAATSLASGTKGREAYEATMRWVPSAADPACIRAMRLSL